MKLRKHVLLWSGLFLCVWSSMLYATNPAVSTAATNEQQHLAKEAALFNKALQAIKSEYVESVTEDKLLENAMRGMVNELDPHSSFLDADDLKDLQSATSGEFTGIGIEIAMEEGVIRVITPLDDSPAQKAGIRPGDLIVRVNHVAVKGMNLLSVVKKMRGPAGTSVTLTIVRAGARKPIVLKVKRESIHINSVKGRLLEPGYAYVRISSFQTMTHANLIKLLHQLTNESNGRLKGVILDLRNNPGGLLDSAADVVSTFLDSSHMVKHGLIVYTTGRVPGANIQLYASRPNDMLRHIPVVVLVNEGSASGAEIVAGALQDNRRAVILGHRTFGKGSVQTVIPLDKSMAIKLTTALYYTPLGRSIQLSGIVPDVVVHEAKFDVADEDASDAAYLRESDLKGHLKSATTNKPAAKSVFNMPTKPSQSDLAKTDYQLLEAFNLLKGLAVLKVAT